MPAWKYTGKEVSKSKAQESLQAVKSACFGCKTHSPDCSIAKAAGEISQMDGCEDLPVREQIHAQITGALKGAKFPVKTPKDLIAAFPDGADTTCQAGDLKMTAGEAGKLLKASDFPFRNAKAVADIIVERAGL
ncbi:MAG: MTH865 family protein [Methanoregulaceae archaeon]